MNMKLLLILCTSLLLALAQNAFTQDEEEHMGSPREPGKDTRTGHIWFSPDKGTTSTKSPAAVTSPATQPVTVNSGAEGKQGYKNMTSPTAMQPGVGSRTRMPTTQSGGTRPSQVPHPESLPAPPR